MAGFRNALLASLLSGGGSAATGELVGGFALLLEPVGAVGLVEPEPLAELEEETRDLLHAHGIDALVTSRTKSLGSTALKMQRKGVRFEEVADRLGVRVIVDSVEACYRVRSILQREHVPWLHEQDDYIAAPKANGYQSLHTAMMTRTAGLVEFQVRTTAMHDHAEHGPAAHAAYKELQELRRSTG